MKRLSLLTFVLMILVGCETTNDSFNGDSPTFTQPVHGEYSDEARRAGNRLFGGSIENPTRMPTGDELARAMDPGADCNCGDTPFDVSNGNFGSDPGYQVSLKNYRNPAHGCTPYTAVSAAEADRLLASQNLSVEAAEGASPVTDREKRTVAAAIKRVQELNGGVLRSGIGPGGRSQSYPFRFFDENGSAQRAGYIKIGRNPGRGHSHYGNSVAQHVHEWAHLIGNQGGYSAYRNYMGNAGKCHITNYAMHSDGEQFAEVFTAFVTEPAILLASNRTSAACRKAFEFFRTRFFPRGDRVQSCIPHPLANR